MRVDGCFNFPVVENPFCISAGAVDGKVGGVEFCL